MHGNCQKLPLLGILTSLHFYQLSSRLIRTQGEGPLGSLSSYSARLSKLNTVLSLSKSRHTTKVSATISQQVEAESMVFIALESSAASHPMSIQSLIASSRKGSHFPVLISFTDSRVNSRDTETCPAEDRISQGWVVRKRCPEHRLQ